MDANLSDKVLLSSWDYFILFHRVQATVIHVTPIIPRDLTANVLHDPDGIPYSYVASGWTPLKLVFALLLLASDPGKLRGFKHEESKHLSVPVSNLSSPIKRSRTAQSAPSSVISDPVRSPGDTSMLVSNHPVSHATRLQLIWDTDLESGEFKASVRQSPDGCTAIATRSSPSRLVDDDVVGHGRASVALAAVDGHADDVVSPGEILEEELSSQIESPLCSSTPPWLPPLDLPTESGSSSESDLGLAPLRLESYASSGSLTPHPDDCPTSSMPALADTGS